MTVNDQIISYYLSNHWTVLVNFKWFINFALGCFLLFFRRKSYIFCDAPWLFPWFSPPLLLSLMEILYSEIQSYEDSLHQVQMLDQEMEWICPLWILVLVMFLSPKEILFGTEIEDSKGNWFYIPRRDVIFWLINGAWVTNLFPFAPSTPTVKE